MRFCLPLIAVVLVGAAARADEKSHRAAAEELLEAEGTEKAMQAVLDQMLDVQLKAHPELLPVKEVLKAFFNKYISYPAVKDELIRMYMEEFTEKELREITAFHRTPVGKKAVEKLPKLMQKGAELGMKRVQEHTEELRSAIEAALKKDKE